MLNYLAQCLARGSGSVNSNQIGIWYYKDQSSGAGLDWLTPNVSSIWICDSGPTPFLMLWHLISVLGQNFCHFKTGCGKELWIVTGKILGWPPALNTLQSGLMPYFCHGYLKYEPQRQNFRLTQYISRLKKKIKTVLSLHSDVAPEKLSKDIPKS